MIDLNLLLYAINRDAPHHEAARTWLEEVLGGSETIALPWSVLLGFLRIATHARVLPNPLTPEQALEVIDGWLDQPNVRVLSPRDDHWRVLRALVVESGTAGNLTTDAHLAALAIENGCELGSSDRDFGRFPRLRWVNPLSS